MLPGLITLHAKVTALIQEFVRHRVTTMLHNSRTGFQANTLSNPQWLTRYQIKKVVGRTKSFAKIILGLAPRITGTMMPPPKPHNTLNTKECSQ